MKKLLLLTLLPIMAFATTQVVTLNIKGMTCLLCTTAIKKSLKHTDGVLKAKVYYNTKKAIVTFDDTKVVEKDLLNAVKSTGYTAKIVKNLTSLN
ncbi:cation transporter [Sulfurimonas sp. SAG-AH-194-C20]|nr:cation transporter [Sulfurimonas sp. SAG-AH-194-C20]MDF1879139.1 cation transporter [Sulfurimonas sp. SAG-AH-194-C20]